jgi:DNA recombination protein RmuC
MERGIGGEVKAENIFMEYLIFGSSVIIIFILLFILMQKQLSSLREQVRQSLENTDQILSQRIETTGKVMSDVQKDLVRLEESNKRIYEVGKDISSLQEILRAPKIRGNLGEFLLSDLLGQILPARHFSLPYQFKSGERVDAVIHLGKRLVPIDSKFPLDNFRKLIEAKGEQEKTSYRKRFLKDVQGHIDSIARKYILPDEGTYNFALMYIPAENVYYEIMVKMDSTSEEKNIIDYAMERKVIPVSPNTFYAYLQTILFGLKGLDVERSAQEIISTLQSLQGDLSRFKNDFDLMGRHLHNARRCYESADRKLQWFGEKLEQLEIPPKAEVESTSSQSELEITSAEKEMEL